MLTNPSESKSNVSAYAIAGLEDQLKNRPPCRFDAFTVMYLHVMKQLNYSTDIWTHRGDRHTQVVPKMLQKLLTMIKNHGWKWRIIDLHDNSIPDGDERRNILTMREGIITGPVHLSYYRDMLTGYAVPEFLKQYL